MSLPFIFSNERRWRILRHVTFWLLWYLFQLVLYSFTPSPLLQERSFWLRIIITAPDTFFYMLPALFLAYTLMDIVIPKLVLPGKYFWAVVTACLLFVLTAALSALLSFTVIDYVRTAIAGRYDPTVAANPRLPVQVRFGLAMLAGLRGSITVGGLAAAIKLMKCFYEKQQTTLQLEKEKINAELQILKAQLHPHFLFNTLNNIYAHTQEVSPMASGMIMHLSALLRYMLYECSKPLVSLADELNRMRNYVFLEKARYGNDLEIAVSLPENTGHLQIAPLLLLPFIENAFKHGAGSVAEHPWISLDIRLQNDCLVMQLINGREPDNIQGDKPGIGIANVRKRLELLYPNNHELNITGEKDIYIINLKVKLAASSLPVIINGT